MRLAMLLFSLVFSFALPGRPDERPKTPSQKKSAAVPREQSLTGCVDEQDGNYVLLDQQTLEKLAALEAVGAGNEAFFAKHVGHKVAVKGRKSSEPNATFKVTSIEAISGDCTPDPEKK